MLARRVLTELKRMTSLYVIFLFVFSPRVNGSCLCAGLAYSTTSSRYFRHVFTTYLPTYLATPHLLPLTNLRGTAYLLTFFFRS